MLTFFFHLCFFPPDDIRFQSSLAGGAIMDGCYATNALRYFTGAEPLEVTDAKAERGDDKEIDNSMRASFNFPNGVTGSYHVNLKAPFSDIIRNKGLFLMTATCTGGTLTMPNFVGCFVWHRINVCPNNCTGRVEQVYGNGESTYELQLQAFVQEVSGGRKCVTDATDAIKTMDMIDRVYRKADMLPRGKHAASPSDAKQSQED